MACRRERLAVAGNGCHWRYLCRTFCGSLRRQQNCHKAHHCAAYQSNRAECKDRSTRKFTANSVAKQRTYGPCDNCTYDKANRDCRFAPVKRLQSYKSNHLFTARTDTAHHAKELRSLSHLAVHAAGNHQHPG